MPCLYRLAFIHLFDYSTIFLNPSCKEHYYCKILLYHFASFFLNNEDYCKKTAQSEMVRGFCNSFIENC